jgi:hypothetical protein
VAVTLAGVVAVGVIVGAAICEPDMAGPNPNEATENRDRTVFFGRNIDLDYPFLFSPGNRLTTKTNGDRCVTLWDESV